MIKVERSENDGTIVICSLESNLTLEMYRRTIKQIRALIESQPADVLVDLRGARIAPGNLLELMRDGIQKAHRAGISIAVVSASALFPRLYQVVKEACYGGQEAHFAFMESFDEAYAFLRRIQMQRQAVPAL